MEHRLGMKSKRRMILSATCLFFIFLTACGTPNYSKTTLEFLKTGAVRLYIVEPWDDTLYDFDELNQMNNQEVNKYNASSHSVTILSSELRDGQARITMEYANDGSYYDLNKKVLFYGTASSAKTAGYNLVGKVSATDGSGELKPADWNEMDTERVIILSENIEIVTPSEIGYVGDGVTVTGGNTASVLESTGTQLRYVICR